MKYKTKDNGNWNKTLKKSHKNSPISSTLEGLFIYLLGHILFWVFCEYETFYLFFHSIYKAASTELMLQTGFLFPHLCIMHHLSIEAQNHHHAQAVFSKLDLPILDMMHRHLVILDMIHQSAQNHLQVLFMITRYTVCAMKDNMDNFKCFLSDQICTMLEVLPNQMFGYFSCHKCHYRRHCSNHYPKQLKIIDSSFVFLFWWLEQICPICLTNPKDMAFGCGHQVNNFLYILHFILTLFDT